MISPLRLRVTRDGVLFVTGLLGVIYEAASGLERINLLLIYAGMMGLPAFMNKDEKDKAAKEEADKNVSPPPPTP
jgi:hypothetical protein